MFFHRSWEGHMADSSMVFLPTPPDSGPVPDSKSASVISFMTEMEGQGSPPPRAHACGLYGHHHHHLSTPTDTWWLPITGTYCMTINEAMTFNRKSRQERKELRNGIGRIIKRNGNALKPISKEETPTCYISWPPQPH